MQRNQTLDALKGICIIFVVITHFHWADDMRLRLGFPFIIDMAVPVFMLISGYVYAASYERNNISTVMQGWGIKRLTKSFLRYTIPYLACFGVEVILSCIKNGIVHAGGANVGVKSILLALITGGWGPGSYYYPILLQLLLVYPLLWWIVRRWKFYGLLMIFALNFGFEWLKLILAMPVGIYRLLVFRYILLLGAGTYFYLYRKSGNKLIESIIWVLGVVFIVCTQYLNQIIWPVTFWVGTSFVAVLYIIPMYKWFISREYKWWCPLLNIGKASYNIFLFQMLFYVFFADSIYKLISYSMIDLCLCLAICLYGGWIFYCYESKWTKNIIKKLSI